MNYTSGLRVDSGIGIYLCVMDPIFLRIHGFGGVGDLYDGQMVNYLSKEQQTSSIPSSSWPDTLAFLWLHFPNAEKQTNKSMDMQSHG